MAKEASIQVNLTPAPPSPKSLSSKGSPAKDTGKQKDHKSPQPPSPKSISSKGSPAKDKGKQKDRNSPKPKKSLKTSSLKSEKLASGEINIKAVTKIKDDKHKKLESVAEDENVRKYLVDKETVYIFGTPFKLRLQRRIDPEKHRDDILIKTKGFVTDEPWTKYKLKTSKATKILHKYKE